MTWFTGLFTYIIVWWMVLFVVLPWGNRAPDNPEPGHAPSAPEKPRLAIKFAATTVIATVVFLGVYGIIESGWINIREYYPDR
jgi:predicted secreted protein